MVASADEHERLQEAIKTDLYLVQHGNVENADDIDDFDPLEDW